MLCSLTFILLLSSYILSLHLCTAMASTKTTGTTETPPKTFNITAISAANGKSTIECWQFTTPIQGSSTPGTVGTLNQQLGDVTNATYTVLPANFDGGLHNAPTAQYVAFLSGQAHVTLPDSDEEVVIKGGAHGLIIVADTADVSEKGHITQYPGDSPTTVLQIPLKDGQIPPHRVLHTGPCREEEMQF